MFRPTPTPEQINNDPACSYWLKDALNTALERDPIDATNDAELLYRVLREHLAEANIKLEAQLKTESN